MCGWNNLVLLIFRYKNLEINCGLERCYEQTIARFLAFFSLEMLVLALAGGRLQVMIMACTSYAVWKSSPLSGGLCSTAHDPFLVRQSHFREMPERDRTAEDTGEISGEARSKYSPLGRRKPGEKRPQPRSPTSLHMLSSKLITFARSALHWWTGWFLYVNSSC